MAVILLKSFTECCPHSGLTVSNKPLSPALNGTCSNIRPHVDHLLKICSCTAFTGTFRANYNITIINGKYHHIDRIISEVNTVNRQIETEIITNHNAMKYKISDLSVCLNIYLRKIQRKDFHSATQLHFVNIRKLTV